MCLSPLTGPSLCHSLLPSDGPNASPIGRSTGRMDVRQLPGDSKLRTYEVELETLTPIWTGDPNRRMSSVRETGLLGALRWWYGVVLSSKGYGIAPRIESRSGRHSTADDHLDVSRLCPVCRFFGTTGWARPFILRARWDARPSVEPPSNHAGKPAWSDDPLPDDRVLTGPAVGCRQPADNARLQRRLGGFMGSVQLRFQEIRPMGTEWDGHTHNLRAALSLIDEHFSIGARAAQGNGVVRVRRPPADESPRPISDYTGAAGHETPQRSYICTHGSSWPTLDAFHSWTGVIDFHDPVSVLIKNRRLWGQIGGPDDAWETAWMRGVLPIAFHARDAIRAYAHTQNLSDEIRHAELGTVGKGKAHGSQVYVSHGYVEETDRQDDLRQRRRVRFRIWGNPEHLGNPPSMISDAIATNFSSMLLPPNAGAGVKVTLTKTFPPPLDPQP